MPARADGVNHFFSETSSGTHARLGVNIIDCNAMVRFSTGASACLTQATRPGDPSRNLVWIPQMASQWHRYADGYKEPAISVRLDEKRSSPHH